MRLDDGAAAAFSPSARSSSCLDWPAFFIVSLSRNYLFVMLVLAGVLARATLLPQRALSRVAATLARGLLALVSCCCHAPRPAAVGAHHRGKGPRIHWHCHGGCPYHASCGLTGALRTFRVPNLFIMTLDLTLRSIVRLGEVALEC
jgi:cobalt/nickel transport system permease protein